MYVTSADHRVHRERSSRDDVAWAAPGWVQRRPFALAAALVAGVIVVVFASAAALGALAPELDVPTRRQVATLVLATVTLALLARWSAWRAVGLTSPLRAPQSTLMALPLVIAAWPLGFGIQGGALALAIALAAELPNSFAEEALMRGVLIRAFAARKRWLTAVVSGVTFGFLHVIVLVWGAPIAELAPLVLLSSLFGIGYACMRMVTASLWAPIALHALFNVSQHVGRGIEAVGEGPSTAALLVGALVFPLYGMVLLRRLPGPAGGANDSFEVVDAETPERS